MMLHTALSRLPRRSSAYLDASSGAGRWAAAATGSVLRRFEL